MKNQTKLLSLIALIAFSSIAAHAQAPAITSQPQSQRTIAGSNVTFNVAVASDFPVVSSGTLRLWLKADAGVITNSNGLVSQWQDQSGNTNHAAQSNTNLQPSLVYPAAIGNKAAVRFDGIQISSEGDVLVGSGDVGIPDAYTSFLVYFINVAGNAERIPVWVSYGGTSGASGRSYYIVNQEMAFASWGNDYFSGFIIPTNTYRIWTDRLNTNRTLLEFFDTTATTSTNINRTTSGLIAPRPGYSLGGFNPSVTDGRNFSGDIAELIYFRGALSETDRIAVENYLKQKYYQSSTSGTVTFQWQFGGNNIAGATNTSLTLSNVQLADEGIYSAVASNSSGVTISSNALLTFSAAPNIATQPQSQEVEQGTNISFTVNASGAFPLSYQWMFNGAAISSATSSVLSLTNVQPANGGAYSAVVSDGITPVTSSNAVLTVDFAPGISGQPQHKTAFAGTNVTFSVTATGYPLSYQWFFNSTNSIVGATSASLLLTNVTTNNAGNYSVLVSNGLGSVSSSNAVLTIINTGSAIVEDFEPGIHAIHWSAFSPTVLATNYGGFVSATHSLWLGGSGSRFATTRPIDVSGGANISFHLRLASGFSSSNSFWDNVELPHEGVVLEYSLNSTNWTTIGTYNTSTFYNWTFVQLSLPVSAQSSSTRFRWRQLANSGSLSDHWALDDIQIVPASSSPTMLTQPQSQTVPVGTNVMLNVVVTGQAPLSYQWLLNSSTVLGSTTSSLTLTSVQLSDNGNYSVIVSNSVGSITSATAVVTVLTPPSISSQPQSQTGVQGTNISFSVTASGSATLNYQWQFNGVAISNATSSTLLLTNVQGSNAGSYSVLVANSVGSVLSSNASLSIDAFPIIVAHPQSQSVIAGTNVSFSVSLESSLPAVSSGTIRLWLKADAGAITNASGKVSQWQDQSSNTNHASQSDTNLQPSLVRPAAIGNRAAVRFDGIQNASVGDYLKGTGDVGLSNAYTSFMVYSVSDSSPVEELPAWIGAVGNWGAGRGNYIFNGKMAFATWGYDFPTAYIIPTNTYRIWTDRFNTNQTLIEMFDSTLTTSTNFTVGTSGQSSPAPGYYVGGLNPLETAGRNFAGDIAELIYFRGSLNETDRTAVENYLKQKYYQSGSPSGSVTFQWQFNGTNISGATNSSLTLSNVQPADAGNYSVVVANAAGSTTSANGVLTVNVPPSITAQPENQTVNAGTTATFTVGAGGTEPFSYQWQKNSNNLAGATNSSLVLNGVQTSDAGNYRVIVTSPFGTITSSNAALAVNISNVRVVSTNATSATSFTLSIDLDAVGTENAVGFSLSFNPSLLSFDSATVGSGLSGAVLISNPAELASGRLGLAVALSANNTFTTGTHRLAEVVFNVGVATNAMITPVNFVDSPTLRQISDAGAEPIPAIFLDGNVSIAAVDFEGDVAPRPNGSRSLSLVDWVQVGRFAANLDSPTNAGEFQRADCAPRSTLGNGAISITDWVQAGRYSIGADPLTPVGGPALAADLFPIKSKAPTAGDVTRTVILETTNQASPTYTVSTRLIAQGNENAMGFSLAFDPAALTFISATNGGNAPNALLNVNTSALAAGRVGVALSLSIGSQFSAGTQEVIKLTFAAALPATGTTMLTFTDSPVLREVSDSTANALPAVYSNVNLILSVPGPLLTISQTAGGVSLSWPASATNFVLESSSTLETNWTSVTSDLTTNAQSISTTLPGAEQQQFFRLKQ